MKGVRHTPSHPAAFTQPDSAPAALSVLYTLAVPQPHRSADPIPPFEVISVTTVSRSYVSRSTFRTCPSFSSMTSLTFYDLLPLTHVYDFHMLTVFTCFSFTYFLRLPCTIKTPCNIVNGSLVFIV